MTPPDQLSLRLFPPRLLFFGIAGFSSDSDFALEPFKRLKAFAVRRRMSVSGEERRRVGE
jgi:hypothetical protein